MSKRWISSLTLCLGLLLGAAAPTRADDAPPGDDPAALGLATRRLVVFKDGHALFVRTGRATADAAGRVFTDEVPDAAILGSFWAFGDGQDLVGMQAQLVDESHRRTETGTCITMVELLRANAGQRVTLGLPEGEEVSGLLAAVLDRPPPEADPAPVPSGRGRPAPLPGPATTEREILPVGGTLVVMKETPRGEIVLPVADVRTLSGAGLRTTLRRTFETKTVTKRLRFDLGPEQAGKDVGITLLYFAPGVRWIPTYRVAGDLETAADLALQAEILNEAEDLEGVALDLVVGVPNFKFKSVVSPLVLEATLRNALQQAAPQLMSQRSSNAFFSNRAGESGGAPAGPLDLAPELMAGGTQDLFVYGVPAFSLPRGARATVPLWQNRVPLRHLYTVDVALGRYVQGGGSYVRERGSQEPVAPLELAKHLVWHQLELKNDSPVPWTTGAALTMQGSIPIGQDLLTYTPVGGTSLLPLTVAVDVRSHLEEEELERIPKAVQHSGHDYARIKKRASLRVTNYRREPTTLRASLALGGRVLVASDAGTIRINDFRAEDWDSRGGDARLNNHSDVEWNVVLEPGATRVLTAEYEFFVR